MTIVGEAFIRIRPDSTQFEAEAERGVTSATKGIAKKVAVVAGAAGVAAAGAFAKNALTGFASFEKQMNEVYTLLPGITGPAMQELSDQALDFSRDLGVLPEKVVPALYQSLSAGVPQDNVFEFLETAQKAAKGGVTELETAVDGISSVVNAYGSEVIDATTASDQMFTAVRLGKTNFEELSRFLFQVTPVAAGLGVEFGDVTASMAALTAQGVPTRVASTQIRQALVEMSKDGSATADLFERLSGQSFRDFVAGGGNVQDALTLLAEEAQRTGVGVNDLFGSVEAGNAALALTSKEGSKAFTNALGEMQNSAGATEGAYEVMDQGLSRTWEKIQARIAVFTVEAGDALAPFLERGLEIAEEWGPILIDAFKDVADAVVAVAEPFIDLGRWITSNRPVFIGLATAVGVGLVAAFYSWATAAAAAATATITALAPVLAPIAAVGVAIAALVAAFVWAYDNVEIFRGAVQAVATFFMDVFWPALKDLAAWLGRVFVGAVRGIGDAFSSALGVVSGFFSSVGDFFSGLVETVASMPGKISSAASGMWDGIKEAFRGVINFIIDAWNGLEFTIPGFDPPGPGPKFGGFTLGVPKIPRLADGGIVRARPGGILANIGEGGRDEAVVPLLPGVMEGLQALASADLAGALDRLAGGLSDVRQVNVNVSGAGAVLDERKLTRMIERSERFGGSTL